jgi:hypothetical protein
MPNRPLIECKELTRLSAESATLYVEYLALRDEVNITPKNDPSLAQKRRDLKKLTGQLRHAHKLFQNHIENHRCR